MAEHTKCLERDKIYAEETAVLPFLVEQAQAVLLKMLVLQEVLGLLGQSG